MTAQTIIMAAATETIPTVGGETSVQVSHNSGKGVTPGVFVQPKQPDGPGCRSLILATLSRVEQSLARRLSLWLLSARSVVVSRWWQPPTGLGLLRLAVAQLDTTMFHLS